MVAVCTVFFEDPFWVAVLESEDEGRFVVARHVFGAEPTNPQLLHFMLYEFAGMRRSEQLQGGLSSRAQRSKPKKALREAAREGARPPSTKAQAALSAALEEVKAERSTASREERRAQAERRFELRSEKRRRKRAGH